MQLKSILDNQIGKQPNLFPLEALKGLIKSGNQSKGKQFVKQFIGKNIEVENGKDSIKNNAIMTQPFEVERPLIIVPEDENAGDALHSSEFNAYLNKEVIGEELVKRFELILQTSTSLVEQNLAIESIVFNDSKQREKTLLKLTKHHDLYVRRLAFKGLDRVEFKQQGQSDNTIFRNELDDVIHDYLYITQALKTIPSIEEFKDLYYALVEEELGLKYHILSVLSWNYDRHSIAVIKETIFGDNQEGNSANLAFELIDSLIDNEFKKLVLPVFENQTYAWKARRLNANFHLPEQSFRKSLEDLMNRDYLKISVWIKACAMKSLNKIGIKDSLRTMKSYEQHPNQFLRSIATNILAGNKDKHPVFQMVNTLKENPVFANYRSYQLIPLATAVKSIKNGAVPGNSIALITEGKFDALEGNSNAIENGFVFSSNVSGQINQGSSITAYALPFKEFANFKLGGSNNFGYRFKRKVR